MENKMLKMLTSLKQRLAEGDGKSDIYNESITTIEKTVQVINKIDNLELRKIWDEIASIMPSLSNPKGSSHELFETLKSNDRKGYYKKQEELLNASDEIYKSEGLSDKYRLCIREYLATITLLGIEYRGLIYKSK